MVPIPRLPFFTAILRMGCMSLPLLCLPFLLKHTLVNELLLFSGTCGWVIPPSMSLVHRIISSFSLPVHAHPKSSLCSSCCRAKLHQLPYTTSSFQSTSPLRLLFAEVWGPAPILSRGSFCYYLFLVDDYSRFAWLFPLKCKYDVLFVFTSFKHK